ncbi:MAG: ATP diphosphatase [Enterobacterales bacterium]|jgi:ATP diphosphatase
MSNQQQSDALQRVIDVMAKLRDPVNGCPWDMQQTWHSLIAFTLEEAYEVADAIESPDQSSLPEELGDLLFQVVFYSRIAEEQNLFDLQKVIHRLCDKLELRHPHVFSDANYTEDELDQAWHQTKAKERQSKKLYSALDDIPLALPALTRAQKLQHRASNEGFDWKQTAPVFAKIDEEILELKQAISNNEADEIQDEMGDLLFTVVNLARHLNLDAETCLRQASGKFERRYRSVEKHFSEIDKKKRDCTDDELETSWQEVKSLEQLKN